MRRSRKPECSTLPSRQREEDAGPVFGRGAAPRQEPASTGGHLLGLVPGDRVVHGRWGEGRVLAVKGAGDRATATVRFAGVGDKTLMLSMAPLSKAEAD